MSEENLVPQDEFTEEFAVVDPEDVASGDKGRTEPVPVEKFHYIGRGLTQSEFSEYVKTHHFGTIPPDYVVLHHTAVPFLREARAPADNPDHAWDADDTLSDEDRFKRRLKRLENMREFYRTNPQYLWDRGPHLFIDERWIWLFTDMFHEGAHAKGGNSFVDANDRFHYSVGIEVIGNYTSTKWSDAIASNVGFAVAALKKHLGTFEITYKRGPNSHLMTERGHHPRHHVGGICSHRDFFKRACPGNAISEEHYIQVLQAGMQA